MGIKEKVKNAGKKLKVTKTILGKVISELKDPNQAVGPLLKKYTNRGYCGRCHKRTNNIVKGTKLCTDCLLNRLKSGGKKK